MHIEVLFNAKAGSRPDRGLSHKRPRWKSTKVAHETSLGARRCRKKRAALCTSQVWTELTLRREKRQISHPPACQQVPPPLRILQSVHLTEVWWHCMAVETLSLPRPRRTWDAAAPVCERHEFRPTSIAEWPRWE